MTKKIYTTVLDKLLREESHSARQDFKKYITEYAAIIHARLTEADGDQVYVLDIEEDRVFVTKCDNMSTAELFVKMMNEDKKEGEEGELEITNVVPNAFIDTANELPALTADDLDESTDPVADSHEHTFEVPKEEWDQAQVLTENEELTHVIELTVYPESSKKAIRIIETYADNAEITDEGDEVHIVASFPDAESMEKAASRLETVSGITSIGVDSFSEEDFDEIDQVIADAEEESKEEELERLKSELEDLQSKFTEISQTGGVSDIDEDESELDTLEEAFNLEKVKNPEMDQDKEIGSSRKKVSINKKSPIIQKKDNVDAEPIEVISSQHKGYERQSAPKSIVPMIGQNQKKDAFSGFTKVPEKGSKDALINSGKGFGAENTKSPVIATKSVRD